MNNSHKQKTDFSNNVITLFTGTTLAQALPFAISPILTRIYSPEDFGVLALFIAISTIFGTISNFRYELAIVLPKSDEDAINIVALSILIAFGLSIILFLLLIIFKNYIVHNLDSKRIDFLIYIVPLSVFLLGLNNVLNFYNTRFKKYKTIAHTKIIRSIIDSIIKLTFGLLYVNPISLILGNILGVFSSILYYLKDINNIKILIADISYARIIKLAKRYIKFPQFSVWSGLLNSLSINLINIIINMMYSITTLGYYSLVNRVLGMPSIFIGSAIGQVFYQQSSEDFKVKGNIKNIFLETLKKLIILSVIIFGLMSIFIENIFLVVFGEQWAIAGTYALILLPLYCIRFISGTLSIILSLLEKQKESLLINIILLFSYCFIFYMSYILNLTFIQLLYTISIVLSIEYCIFLIYYYTLVNKIGNN